MSTSTFQDFYQRDVQGLYALIVLPALFLLYRVGRGRPGVGLLAAAGPFVDGYAIAVALETILDPLVTGPLVRALGIADSAGGTATTVVFVLLGDFRVYLLLFGLIAIGARRSWTSAAAGAAAWTLVVPAVAYATNAGLRSVRPELDPNSIWLIYELLFAALALMLRTRLVAARVPASEPALRTYLRATLLYVATYYGLWALADALIQFGHLDVGWLLRILPNQLYYSFWVPMVFFAFFARR